MKTEKEYEVVIYTPSSRTRCVAELFDSVEKAKLTVEHLKTTKLFKDSKFKVFEVKKTYTLVEQGL